MKVKDILILCCDLVEEENVKSYLNGQTANDEDSAIKDCELLLNCYNLITDEISREYYRFKTVETFTPENGVIEFTKFTFNPILVDSVKSLDGADVTYKVNPVKIYVDKTVKVEYAYACPERSLNDESDYSFTKISKRVLAYGTVVEYMLIKGMYEQAVMWRDAYRSALLACLSVRKSRKVKEREWY